MPTKESLNVRERLRILAYFRREIRRLKESGEIATQRDVAKKTLLHEGTVSNLLRGGKGSVGLDVVLAVSRTLGVPAGELLFRDPDPQWFLPGADGLKHRSVIRDGQSPGRSGQKSSHRRLRRKSE